MELTPQEYPMPREEFMRRELLSFARKVVVVVFASLLFAAIVYPWRSTITNHLIVLSLFVLAGIGMAFVSKKGAQR